MPKVSFNEEVGRFGAVTHLKDMTVEYEGYDRSKKRGARMQLRDNVTGTEIKLDRNKLNSIVNLMVMSGDGPVIRKILENHS